MSGTGRPVEGNGWDAVALDAGATLTIPVTASGPIDLEIRLLTPRDVDPTVSTTTRFRLHAGDTVTDLAATPEPDADFTVVATSVDLPAGAPLRVEAVDPITVQSVTGFVPDPGPPAGWALATTTDDAVIWQRAR